MVQLHWGHKRTCLSCQARFYDMRKSPIVCPHCQAVFEPYAASRGRRRQDLLKDFVAPVEIDFQDSLVEDSLNDGGEGVDSLDDDDLFQESGT